jgi:hypothetical protein
MPVWVNPSDVVAAQLITTSVMNDDIFDNLRALHDPPTALGTLDEGSEYTTTSTSFADIDATSGKFAQTIVTGGGDVLIGAVLTLTGSTTANLNLNVHDSVAGADLAANDGLCKQVIGTGGSEVVTFLFLHRSVAAGSHTYKLRWKVSTGTVTMNVGGDTSNQRDVHPQFWVREIS